MCDEHSHDHAHAVAGPLPTGGPLRAGPSRRTVLRNAGLMAVAAAVPFAAGRSRSALAAGSAADPLVRMALHVHASFSEGGGSIGSQLDCARQSDVDVVWFTEHDWRMQQHNYRTSVSFDSLTREDEFGRPIVWRAMKLGSPTRGAGGIVTNPVSPNDPSSTRGALQASVTASSSSAGDAYVFFGDSGKSRNNYRGNIAGTTLQLDVFPQTVGTDGWGLLRIMLSNHPATGGRGPGKYFLEYHFGASGSAVAQGFTGIVPVATPANQWTTVQLNPAADIARLWPDLVAADNSVAGIWLGAGARRNAQAAVVFDYLRFARTQPVTLSPFQLQRQILGAYAGLYSDITAICGQEVSFLPEHLGWLGGDDYLMSYDNRRLVAQDDPADTNQRARSLAARGGTIAINHPFGAEGNVSVSSPKTVAQLATQYLKYGAYGATMLEVGYADRGGVDLDHHLALWDVLSRNAVYLTGTGVNDNHDALDGSHADPWANDINRFTSSVWAPSKAATDLLTQLRSGRSFSTELTAGDLAISIGAAGVAMGSVSVRPDLTSRAVTVTATGLPSGASIELLQGAVDYAGAGDPSANSAVVGELTAQSLRSGSADVTVDTRASSYVRALVRDSTGRGVGLSNPIWLLHEASHTAVPAERRAADTTW